jgi:hypothetical protein
MGGDLGAEARGGWTIRPSFSGGGTCPPLGRHAFGEAGSSSEGGWIRGILRSLTCFAEGRNDTGAGHQVSTPGLPRHGFMGCRPGPKHKNTHKHEKAGMFFRNSRLAIGPPVI